MITNPTPAPLGASRVETDVLRIGVVSNQHPQPGGTLPRKSKKSLKIISIDALARRTGIVVEMKIKGRLARHGY